MIEFEEEKPGIGEYKDYSFLNTFKRYFRYSTDSPIEYSDILSVQVLGHVMGYDSVNYIQPRSVHHNMYSLLVGLSTLTRKTTAQGLAIDTYNEERLASTESTPERLITDLSENSEMFWYMGEFSRLLKGIKGGSYLAGFAEILNDLHGCPRKFTRRLQPKKTEKFEFVINKAYLSISSTITSEVLEENLTEELAVGGLMARYLIRKGEPRPKPRGRLRKKVLDLKESCRNYIEAILKMDRNIVFVFDDKALERYNQIEEECYRDYGVRGIDPFIGRYLNYVIAIADILLVSDAIGYAIASGRGPYEFSKLVSLVLLIHDIKLVREGENGELIDVESRKLTGDEMVVVPTEYIERSYEIVKPCFNYVSELVRTVGMDRYLKRVRNVIKNAGRIDYPSALRNSNMRVKDFKESYETLIERKEIKWEIPKTDGGSTPITKTFFVWIGN